jgi:nucleotide-binding universal stress UspA family protein
MKIVVGVDESPRSAGVLERAVMEARTHGASLDIVHVFHQPPLAYVDFPVDVDAIAVAVRKSLWEFIDGLLDGVDDVEMEKIDLWGYPPDALADHAADVGADLLVVGTRSRGQIGALVLGSTSHRAIHIAPCDVLVVKAEEQE